MLRITTWLLLVFLLVPSSLTWAQKSRGTKAAADKSWTKFYAAFRAAVKKRDRAALKRMMTSDFYGGPDNENLTPEQGLNLTNWQWLQKSLALGTKPFGKGSRITKNCGYTFELGADKQWRWSGLCWECDC